MVWKIPGHGLRIQMFPARPEPAGYLVPVLVQNHGKHSRHRGSCAAGLHGIQRRLGTAEETSIFRLPPGIYDHGLPLADHVVVPTPHVRLDRLAHGGHVLEMVVVLAGSSGPALRSIRMAVGEVWKMLTLSRSAIRHARPASG